MVYYNPKECFFFIFKLNKQGVVTPEKLFSIMH